MMTANYFTPFSLNLGGRLLEINHPQVMGILNVTPDSFYAASRMQCEKDLVKRVEDMLNAGVDIIDIGACSTRPGATSVSAQEEIERLAPAMKLLRNIAPDLPVSVDTFRAEVACRAVEEMGVNIINDIAGGLLDDKMMDTVARLRVPYILTHTRSTPDDMMNHTHYNNVTSEVITELSEKVARLSLLGVNDVIIDPGFGFAKDLGQNYHLLRELRALHVFGKPLLVGISRKSMITRVLDVTPADALNGTTVLNTLALLAGAAILRVHDVKEAVQAVKLIERYNACT